MATSIFAITDALLPAMIEKRWGRVLTIGSSGVVQPIANLRPFQRSSRRHRGWSKTLAGEVARHGVTVNMILPGRIDTDRVRELDGIKAEKTGSSLAAVQEASRNDFRWDDMVIRKKSSALWLPFLSARRQAISTALPSALTAE